MKSKKKRTTSKEENIDLIQIEQKLSKTQIKLTAATIAAPLILSYLVKAIDIMLDKKELVLDVSLFLRLSIATILALSTSGIVFILNNKVNKLQTKVNKKSVSPSELKAQNSGLSDKNTELLRLRSFYLTCYSAIRNFHEGKRTLDDVGREIAVALHNSVITRNKGKCDDFTVNIYLTENKNIHIIGNYHEGTYIDPPKLLRRTLSITDPQIAGFYCVKCIQSKKKVFVLRNWKEMVESYILDSELRIAYLANRKVAMDHGFMYNQSIGFKEPINYTNETSLLVEFVSYGVSQFANEADIEKQAEEYKVDYLEPILATIEAFYIQKKERA